MWKRLPTRIDRINIIYEIKGHELHGYEHLLQKLADAHGQKVVDIKKGGVGSRVSIRFGTSKRCVRVVVQRCYNICFVKYDFKPDDLDDVAFIAFDAATAILGAARLRNVMTTGRLTYVEVAVDVVGQHTKNLLFFQRRAQATLYGSRTVKGTYYIGSSQSSQSMICYNKATAPNATDQEKALKRLLRIEARLRASKLKGIAPIDLQKIANPFLDLRVCQRITLNQRFAAQPLMLTAIKACVMLGSPHAFRAHPKTKQEIMLAAKLHPAVFWKPKLLMKNWGERVREQLRFKLLEVLPATS